MADARRVLGVLSGEDYDPALLRAWALSADVVLAADGGANTLHRLGISPQLLIGDLDSVRTDAYEASEERIAVTDQDTTDCDKLLGRAHADGHVSITLAGVEGDLPDHVLATLQSAAKSPLDVRVAYRRGIGWILKSGASRKIFLPMGRRVSLMPLEPCQGVTLTGVHWPLKMAELSPRGMVSVSNRSCGADVVARVETGAALLFAEFMPEEMPIW